MGEGSGETLNSPIPGYWQYPTPNTVGESMLNQVMDLFCVNVD